MANPTLTQYLDAQHVRYEVIPHLPAFTAQAIAGLTHTPGKEVAKAVMVRLDDELVMAVLPANFRVDLKLLRAAAKAHAAALAPEDEFFTRFPDCETGAMPPFGNLYHIRVFADESLTRDAEITFNAGTHREVIRMGWKDFVRLANPVVVRLASRPGSQAA